MDSFQSVESGQGLLKDQYSEDDTLSEALKRKRQKLSATMLNSGENKDAISN